MADTKTDKPKARKSAAKKPAAKKSPARKNPPRKAAGSGAEPAGKAPVRSAAGAGLSLRMRDDKIAVIEINQPGEPQNTLKQAFAADFEKLIGECEARGDVRGLIIRSTKPGSFVAGADIKMFDRMSGPKDIEALSHGAQAGFDRIEQLKIPVVAAIDGACLGGGLELAMACHARVASRDRRTALGLPEVMLGLLPGAGGTQRLPRLIGIANGLDLMLTGRHVRPDKARKLGLVDEVVDPADLEDAATQWVDRLSKRGAARDRKRGLSEKAQKLALEDNRLGRQLLFSQARKQALAKSGGHYPAISEILDVVETGANRGFKAGLKAESEAFGRLAFSSVSIELRNIFHATNELKKESGAGAGVEARPVQRVAVLGAGLMGAGIAVVTVDKADLDVRLKDRDAAGVDGGMRYLRRYFDGRIKRKALSSTDAARQLARVTGTTDYSGFGRVDLVIEAVFEDLDLKHRMLRDIEEHGHENTIFASNTSSLPIGDIAKAAQRPQNVIGLHYFSPVEKMPLLEIIVTPDTAPEVTAACVALGKRQGKTVIVVNDGPGFYTTRILAPFMNEAARMIGEGLRIEDIDKALRDWGFPVGPITLMDEVGIDVGAKIGPVLEAAFGERMAPAGSTDLLLKDGRYGRKAKKGFYRYDTTHKNRKPVDESVYKLLGVKPDRSLPAQEIAERCALLMLNEAAFCLGEGILNCPRDGDIGAIFGLGFPPFRGGPFRYADAIGPRQIVDRMNFYAGRYGARFTPAPRLQELAKAGKTFY